MPVFATNPFKTPFETTVFQQKPLFFLKNHQICHFLSKKGRFNRDFFTVFHCSETPLKPVGKPLFWPFWPFWPFWHPESRFWTGLRTSYEPTTTRAGGGGKNHRFWRGWWWCWKSAKMPRLGLGEPWFFQKFQKMMKMVGKVPKMVRKWRKTDEKVPKIDVF